MILSDRDIRQALRAGRIVVKPKPDLTQQLGTSSLDLRLGHHFRVFKHRRRPFIDPYDAKTTTGMTEKMRISRAEPYVIQPQEFVLATVLEWIELPADVSARIDGRSSLGRIGLVVHSTAGHVDAGFKGTLTMELSNIGMMPILLYPRMRICQLVFEVLSSPTEVPYTKRPEARYHGQTTPIESRIAEDEQR